MTVLTSLSSAGGKPSIRFVDIPADIGSLSELLAELGKRLSFPPFFGKNLDAFWDCVRVLEGVGEYRIVVRHCAMPNLPEKELSGYIELLWDSVEYWDENSGEHKFEAWFPDGDRQRLEAFRRKR